MVDTQADTQADILAPMLVEATDTTAMGDKVSLEAPEVVTVIRLGNFVPSHGCHSAFLSLLMDLAFF